MAYHPAISDAWLSHHDDDLTFKEVMRSAARVAIATVRAANADAPVTRRDPVALLLAEAERLMAIPYADTEFYTDHQERQRRARCYQDAAELLEKKGPR